MKKIIALSIAAFVIMLTSCNQNQVTQLENELETLLAEKETALELHDQFNQFLIEIEANLAEIKRKEKIISQAPNERPQSLEQSIRQHMTDINNLMDNNRRRLAEVENLRRQMRAANVNTERMQALIKSLEARIEEQEAQIRELQEKLRVANARIEVLVTENQQITEENIRKQEKIEEQVIELNTGFYTMGTSQALREAGVITRSGGFIGIGRTLTVNDDAALKNFTRIDIREFTRLETNSERIEIITPHAPGSFRINDSDRRNMVIEITNPAEFWKSSKFLVVRVR